MNKQELLEIIKTAANRKVISLNLNFGQLTELPPEIGQLTSLQSLDLRYNQLSELPPEIGQLTSLQSLNLRYNQLSELPPEIGQLTSLQSLNLSNNQLSKLPPEIGQLTSLQSLYLWSNQLSELPPEIGQLTSLQSLYLLYNQLSKLPLEIGQLISLQSLYLLYNQLSKLPLEIGQLTSLQSLDLADNQLSKLPLEIGQLTSLQSLYLRGNQLSEIPLEIGQITSLQSLDLSNNQLSEIPPEIVQLTSLQYLALSNNQLSEISPEIVQLDSLRSLYLSNNQLSEIPSEIVQLNSLRSLDISNNQLSEISPEIIQLTSLRSLDIRGNQLSKIPSKIRQLVNLSFLDISSNKIKTLPPEIFHISQVNYGQNLLSSIPPEIRKKKWNAVRNFLKQQLEQEVDRIYEAKLLIVGEGGAGKTTLAKKIENEEYELISTEQSTEGIDIIRWTFPFKDNKDFIVNIWDFGGQEIYHATHQFFLTKRSLYILVADSRKEDTDFFYWLNVVDLLSETSPILIVKNEKQDRKREINNRQLRGEFLNLKEVLSSNLANNRGLPEIKQAIERYIATLPHVGNELPKTWVKVRKALETNPHNHITLEQYLDICKEHGFTRPEDALQLSEYLHDLGVCLHFQEDPVLYKTVILKPTWGTDAVYRVLDNSQVIQNLGMFNQTDLDAIWYEEQYATMRHELLRLMMNFKLCYEIPSNPKNYISPQLLSLNQSDYPWNETDNLLLRYSYEFMPKGILTRFIVEMHRWIENQSCVWKTGVVLSQNYARAEVIELYHRKEIRIRVCGNHKRDLLTKVRHEFDKIHTTYDRLKYSTLVPCNCKTCKNSQTPYFYPLERLYKFQSDSQKEIQCQIGYEMVSVRTLIDDINKSSGNFLEPMSDSGKYQIHAKTVFINDQNQIEQQIGEQNNYANDPKFQKAVDDISQILKQLQDKLQTNYPTATESEALEIIEVEFEEIRTSKPVKWKMITRYLLDRERWLNGGKAAILAGLGHLAEENVFGKAGVAFLESFSEEE